MAKDFKISKLREDADGITATVAVYQGAITTEDELQHTGDPKEGQYSMQPVTRYRRTKLLKTKTVTLKRSLDDLLDNPHESIRAEAQKQLDTGKL